MPRRARNRQPRPGAAKGGVTAMERPVHFRSEGGVRVETGAGGAPFDGVRMQFPASSDNVGFARTAAAVFAAG